MNARHVFRFDDGTEQDQYRNAVSTIIGDIQRETGFDLCLIADAIGVSNETICNAHNKRTNLNAMYLARIGRVFGGAYLNPYHALYCIQAAPLDPATRDILPLLTMAAHNVACARDPDGPGGCAEVPQEKAAMLKAFKPLHRELAGHIAKFEEVLA